MIINTQDDILTLFKMYMKNTKHTQVDICKALNLKDSGVSRTLKGKNSMTINTLLNYVNAVDGQIVLDIIPKQNDNTSKDSTKDQ